MSKQTYLDSGVTPITSDTKVEKFIKNPLSMVFFYDLQIVSFLLANIAILFILNYYFQLSQIVYIFTAIFGIFLSVIIIKTYYFLDISSAKDRFMDLGRYLLKRPKFQDVEKPSINIIEFIGFTFRNIFFNLLNDSFIVLIYWIFTFTILIWIQIAKIPENFTEFAEVMALVGIISGLFQIYIKDYKQNSSNMIKSIIEEKMSIINSISLKDFQIFLIKKNKENFVKVIQKIIQEKDIISQETLEAYRSIGREKIALSVHNIHVPRMIDSNSINGFFELEMYIDRDQNVNIRELHYQYEDYLDEKRNLFKSKITEKNISELRKILFSMIIFSDEITISLLRVSSGIPRKTNTPTTFVEFYSNFQRECVYDLLHLVMLKRTG